MSFAQKRQSKLVVKLLEPAHVMAASVQFVVFIINPKDLMPIPERSIGNNLACSS